MRRWKLVVRTGGEVEHERFGDAPSALAAAEERWQELVRKAGAQAIDLKVRRFEAAEQVVGRVELSGPGRTRAGIDVHGDGSSQAYTGFVRRRALPSAPRESAFDALRHAVR